MSRRPVPRWPISTWAVLLVGLGRSIWSTLRPWERLLVVGAAVTLVLLTADVVAGGLATYADEQLLGVIGTHDDPASTAVSAVGSLGISVGVLLIVALVTAQATWRLWPLAVAAITVGSGLLVVVVLKAVVARPGPGQADLPEDYPGYFPSGHAATAGLCLGTACFLLLSWRGHPGHARATTPATAGIVVGVSAAGLVGAAAVLNGQHWASDVIGSIVIVAVLLTLGFAAGSLFRATDAAARAPSR